MGNALDGTATCKSTECDRKEMNINKIVLGNPEYYDFF